MTIGADGHDGSWKLHLTVKVVTAAEKAVRFMQARDHWRRHGRVAGPSCRCFLMGLILWLCSGGVIDEPQRHRRREKRDSPL